MHGARVSASSWQQCTAPYILLAAPVALEAVAAFKLMAALTAAMCATVADISTHSSLAGHANETGVAAQPSKDSTANLALDRHRSSDFSR